MNDFLRKFTIPFSVFITGACVLIIELVAIRMLAPYFGNSIFTVSGVITIVLLALSIGYYYGGKLADKRPEEKVFYNIILLGGVLTIVLHIFSLFFLPFFSYKASIVFGPIISSFLLFFAQNVLLGMLSPFAVKLQKARLEDLGVGSASGQIFFWSTLGSIFGSLGAGFLLIPNFNIDQIIIGVGLILIVLGLCGRIKLKLKYKSFLAILLTAFSLFLAGSINITSAQDLFNEDSLYQRVIVFEGSYHGKPAIFLQQDRNSSGAMLTDSKELAYEYTKYYALYQLFNDSPKNTLSIGGGAYSVPKALLEDDPNIMVDVAEIDPLIYELGKKYFNVPADEPRLKNFAVDGRRFLHDSNKNYDVIFSDAYSSFYSTPEHLTTKEFFQLAKDKMTDNGVFIANVVGSLKERPESFLLSEIKTFKSVFENSYFFAVESSDLERPQNFIFVGYKGKEIIDFNSIKIRQNKNYIISGISKKAVDINKINLDRYPLLTDDFAPVDYLISREFTNPY